MYDEGDVRRSDFMLHGTGGADGDAWLTSILGMCLEVARINGSADSGLCRSTPDVRAWRGRVVMALRSTGIDRGLEHAIALAWNCGHARLQVMPHEAAIPAYSTGKRIVPSTFPWRLVSFAREHQQAASAMLPAVDRVSAALGSESMQYDERVMLSRLAARHLLVAPIIAEGWWSPTTYHERIEDDDVILAGAAAGTIELPGGNYRSLPIRGCGDGRAFMRMLAEEDEGTLHGLMACSSAASEDLNITHDLPAAILYCMPDDGTAWRERAIRAEEAALGVREMFMNPHILYSHDEAFLPFITERAWMSLKNVKGCLPMATRFLAATGSGRRGGLTADPGTVEHAADGIIHDWKACENGESVTRPDDVGQLLACINKDNPDRRILPDPEEIASATGTAIHEGRRAIVTAAVALWHIMAKTGSNAGWPDMFHWATIHDAGGFCTVVAEDQGMPRPFVKNDVMRCLDLPDR